MASETNHLEWQASNESMIAQLKEVSFVTDLIHDWFRTVSVLDGVTVPLAKMYNLSLK